MRVFARTVTGWPAVRGRAPVVLAADVFYERDLATVYRLR